MTDSETRVLARTAAVLLLVSAARYGWELRRGPPVLPEPRDDLAELLAESRRLEEENARRARPLGAGERIDPNQAPEAELDRLPGIGPATARAIVEARARDPSPARRICCGCAGSARRRSSGCVPIWRFPRAAPSVLQRSCSMCEASGQRRWSGLRRWSPPGVKNEISTGVVRTWKPLAARQLPP